MSEAKMTVSTTEGSGPQTTGRTLVFNILRFNPQEPDSRAMNSSVRG